MLFLCPIRHESHQVKYTTPNKSSQNASSSSQLREILYTDSQDMLVLFINPNYSKNRVCGVMVRVPCYRSTGPGSIPCATRFSEE
jgi:hypothetical protein